MNSPNLVEIKLKTVGGESITEATIGTIYKKPGDFVALDEPLFELETDKVNMEIGAEASGTIQNIFCKTGDTVKVGDLLATLIPGEASQVKPQISTEVKDVAVKPSAVIIPEIPKSNIAPQGSSPSALRTANENPNNFAITASARGGSIITKLDMVQNLAQTPVASTTSNATSSAQTTEEKRHVIKMSPLRRTIARRLKEAQNNAALLTTFNEVDMSAVMDLRKKYQDDFQKKYGVKLGFMSLFTHAAMLALREIPAVNGEVDGDNIIYKNYYNIGVAIGSEKGLVVPVIRDIDKMGLHEIEKAISAYAVKANKNSLTAGDFADGTFTISNGGVYGSLMSTPIVNPPQSAILGMHSIVQRPVVVDGAIVIRPMMYLALSYDHRIIDGKEAVTFLVKIKNYIENPQRMLLFI